MESKTPIVEIEHVNKSYHRGTHIIPVLVDITLDIMEGEFLAFIAVFKKRFLMFAARFPSTFHAIPSLKIAGTQTAMAIIFFLQVFYADIAVDTARCYHFFRKTHLNPSLFSGI